MGIRWCSSFVDTTSRLGSETAYGACKRQYWYRSPALPDMKAGLQAYQSQFSPIFRCIRLCKCSAGVKTPVHG